MNYLPSVSYGVYGGATSTEKAAYFVSWGLMSTLVAASFVAVLKRWNGAAWVPACLKRHNGSEWVLATLRVYKDGSWGPVNTSGS